MHSFSAGLALAITASLGTARPLPAQPASSSHDSTIVVLLGTGTPVPAPHTAGPSTAVIVGKRLFIFDAGAGVERQLSGAHLSNVDIEALFFTHLHSDHTLGYPDLIFTSWVFGRRAPLKAYGPRGLRAMTDHLIAAFASDIDARIKGPEGAIKGGYLVRARDVSPGVIYDSAGVKVRAITVPHIPGQPAYAYRIDTPTRSVVISGDIGPTDVLIPWARGVDVLVHEVVKMSAIEGTMPGGKDAGYYMRTAHTPTNVLGSIAARAQPKLLVLSHIIPTGADEQEMIAAVRSGGFKGRIAFGHDLDRY